MRKIALLFISIFVTQLTLQAQISDKTSVFNSIRSSRSFSFIDINGDGLLDIESITSGSFSIFINEGDYKFSTIRTNTLGIDLDDIVHYEFAFIDYDADGDQDLIATNSTVRIYENVDGTSFVQTSFEFDDFGLNGLSYSVEDFNSDGYEEFVMYNSFLSDLTIYEFENNAGEIQLKTSTESDNYNGLSHYLLDLNNDGKDEIALRHSNGSVHFFDYANNGFNNPIIVEDLPIFGGMIQDINNDGFEDIVYQTNQKLFSRISTGIGFSEPEEIFSGSSCENGYFAHDYDQDGDFDILHGKCTSYGTFWQENVNGNFADPKRINEVGYQMQFIREADINNDGVLDIVTADNREYLGCIGRNADGTGRLANVIAARVNQNDLSFQNVDNEGKGDIALHAFHWAGILESNNDYKGVKTIFNSEWRITDVKFADVDNDNDQDILILQSPSTTSSVDTALVLLENLGSSYSNPRFILGDHSDGKMLINDDYDNDGDIDIIVISSFKGLKYLVNDGTGHFTVSNFTGVTGSHGVSVDITNDGFKDLVVRGQSKSYYYENDTQGSFMQRVELPIASDAHRFKFADFDHDNDLDLVISDYNSFIKIFSNENSNFTEEYSVDITSYDIEIADFNEDGRVDIITSNDLKYLVNNGGFNFTLMESGEETSYSRIAIGQGDDDSRIELVGIEDQDYAEVYLHKNIAIEGTTVFPDNDNDGYTEDVDCDDTDANINPDAMEIPNNNIDENCDDLILIIDNDNDGYNSDDDCDDEDASINPGAIEIPDNNVDENCDNIIEGGFGQFTFTDKVELYQGEDEVNNIFAYDVNQDGLNDIIICTFNQVILYKNEGEHEYSELIIDTRTGANFYAADVADMDNDGLFDIVTSAEGDGNVSLYINLGAEGFKDERIVTIANRAKDLKLADFDDDGNIDIVTAVSLTPSAIIETIWIISNAGNGNYLPLTTLSGSEQKSESLLTFDIDQDGDLDVFGASLISNQVYWFENLGSMQFGSKSLISDNLNGAQSIDIGDLDNDGNYDLVVANRNSVFNAVSRFEYMGSGNFGPEQNISFSITSKQINDIYLADLNLDGFEDICFSEDNSGNVGYLLNRGNETFELNILDSNAQGASAVFASDLDDDGDLEVLYSTKTNMKANYFINDILMTSTEEITSLNELVVYPNPFTRDINFEFGENVEGLIKIFDVHGKLIHAQKVHGNNISLNFESYTGQIYYYQILDHHENVIAVDRIIKL